jgi:hypothetical protein
MSGGPWPAIASRVAGLALIGVPVGIWQELSLTGWLVYGAFLVPVAALGGYASWWGARKAEERIAARDGRSRPDEPPEL